MFRKLFAISFAILLALTLFTPAFADDGDEGDTSTYCQAGSLVHPVGQKIAASYGVTYAQVMDWYCAGYGFGEIKQALRAGLTPAELAQQKLDKEDSQTDGDAEFCPPSDRIHPVGQRLASTYNVEYQQVMEWFCAGYGMGEIKHALKTGLVSGEKPGDLLLEKTSIGGWGNVWRTRGFIGRPDNTDPKNWKKTSPPTPSDDPDLEGQSEDPGPPYGKGGKPEKGIPPGQRGRR